MLAVHPGRILKRELAAREVNELHVEAGFRLNGSLLREDCVDELLVYLMEDCCEGRPEVCAPVAASIRC